MRQTVRRLSVLCVGGRAWSVDHLDGCEISIAGVNHRAHSQSLPRNATPVGYPQPCFWESVAHPRSDGSPDDSEKVAHVQWDLGLATKWRSSGPHCQPTRTTDRPMRTGSVRNTGVHQSRSSSPPPPRIWNNRLGRARPRAPLAQTGA